jgi:hypothetical protein
MNKNFPELTRNATEWDRYYRKRPSTLAIHAARHPRRVPAGIKELDHCRACANGTRKSSLILISRWLRESIRFRENRSPRSR